MKKTNLIIFALILAVSTIGASCSFLKGDALKSSIDEGISMLEAKKYEEFLNRFVHPDDKAKMPEIKKIAEDFGKGRADDVLAALKKAKEQEPEYNADKTMATFKFDANANLKTNKPLTFKKTNDVWYIVN